MREIKFRGKIKLDSFHRKDQGDWAYGYFKVESSPHFDESAYFIIEKGKAYQVIPETVGQYTGLKDKNGKEIYEGDIVKHEDGAVMIVKWIDKCAGFVVTYRNLGDEIIDYITLVKCGEVIGNIYENPELEAKRK